MKKSEMQVTLIDHMGTDLSVVNAARVSHDKKSDWEYKTSDTSDEAYEFICKGWEDITDYDRDYGRTLRKLSEKDTKLIHYLAKHKHKSPFNHAFLSFRVKAPIFVARQLVKHEYLPWNEVSRRYVSDEPEFYDIKFRWAADNVKQGSGLEVDYITQNEATQIYWEAVDKSLEAYNKLLEMGICAEQARTVLPLDSVTEWIWSGSLFAFMKMCKLRMDSHAQQESREIAERVFREIKQLFPVSAEALMEYGK